MARDKAGRYNASPDTRTEGEESPLQTDNKGRALVNIPVDVGAGAHLATLAGAISGGKIATQETAAGIAAIVAAMFPTWNESDTSIAEALTVTLDMGADTARKLVEVYAGSSGATNAVVSYGDSTDDLIAKAPLAIAAGSYNEANYETSYRYVRVAIAAANDNDIRIKAGR